MSIQRIIPQIGGAEAEASVLRERILNSPNCEIGSGTVYYVSCTGDDSNDGLSPETAINSYMHISKLPLKAGDKVLFERGSVFRTSNRIELVNGVYYGAYGDGEKPKIYGSLRNYADPLIWCKADVENVWRTEINGEETAGMINFNNDELVGVWQVCKEDLSSEGDFYHDKDKGAFYLYLREGNPGEVFNNIEVATTMMFMHAMRRDPAENIKIENLCFKYATFGAIDIGLAKNVHVTNCEFGWHGGRVYQKQADGIVRYGNAIEFWHKGNDITVDNCWIYQVFDAAMTFQGQYNREQAYFTNVKFENNLIEYCSMNIEYWLGTPQDEKTPYIADISVKGNIIRFGGYGWGGVQRYNRNKEGQAMLLGWNYSYDDMHNFVITENILDCSDCYMIYLKLPKEQEGLVVYGNKYFQKKPTGLNEYIQTVKGIDIIAENQQDFEEAISAFDSKPTLVKWLAI